MSRVFTSEGTGAAVYVFSDDHCPPHVHARHRGEGWVVRVSFSYINRAMELMSIEPTKSVPLRRAVNRLLDEIQDRLPDCRRSWWMIKRSTCLENQWARVLTSGGVALCDPVPGSKKVAGGNYNPETRQLRLTFEDGTAEEVGL
jgi:hypothetical protein